MMIDTDERMLLLKRIAARDLWNLFICGGVAVGTCAGYLLVALLSRSHLVWGLCGAMPLVALLCMLFRGFLAVRSHHCLFLAHQRRELHEWRGY